MATNDRNRLLTPAEAATHLKVSLSFLAKARVAGTGPHFIKIGRKVVYRLSALENYVASQTRTSTRH